MEAPNAGNILLGRGALYFDRFAAGTTTRTGEQHLGNCTVFELTTADETKEKYESMTQASALYKSVTTKRDVELKITGDEFSLDNLSHVLMGTTGTLTQTSGTVTGETLTTKAKGGRWFPTAKRKISTVVVKVAAYTKTLGTDYKVDETSGRIYIVPGGGIADDATVTVDYAYATISVPKVAGGVSGSVEGYLRFVGDPAAGPKMEVECWRVSFTPDGALGLISDDYGNWSLKGKVQSDLANHPTEPLYRVLNLTDAASP